MSKTVLVVEDDPRLREVVQSMLELEGYETVAAADGVEALEKLDPEAVRPDIIILDLMMPRMNGYAFAEELQRRGLHPGIPIIVVTADARAQEKAKQIQAQGHLTKPFDLIALLTEVERVTGA